MSEVPFFGRNPVYIGTLAVFVGLNFGVVYAKNTSMLLAFRFLTGFFGSPVLATGGASIADIFRPSKAPYALSIYGMANVLGPVLGPLCGGFAAQFKGWKCAYRLESSLILGLRSVANVVQGPFGSSFGFLALHSSGSS